MLVRNIYYISQFVILSVTKLLFFIFFHPSDFVTEMKKFENYRKIMKIWRLQFIRSQKLKQIRVILFFQKSISTICNDAIPRMMVRNARNVFLYTYGLSRFQFFGDEIRTGYSSIIFWCIFSEKIDFNWKSLMFFCLQKSEIEKVRRCIKIHSGRF